MYPKFIISADNNYPYNILVNRLIESIKETNKGDIVHIKPQNNSKSIFMNYNLDKLNYWCNELNKSDNLNKNIILLDADMIVKDNLDHVFKDDFDICYTINPLNSGVLFIKNNINSLKFFNKWLDVSQLFLKDLHEYEKYSNKYPGFIQTSFGYLLDNYKEDIKLKTLPCSIYNACNKEHWEKEEYKILHLRPPLRKKYVSK